MTRRPWFGKPVVYLELSDEDMRRARILEEAGGYSSRLGAFPRVIDDAIRQAMVVKMRHIEASPADDPRRRFLPELYAAIETP